MIHRALAFPWVLLPVLVLVLSLFCAACGDDDSGDPCEDACPAADALRCEGAMVQRCLPAPDGCLAWEPEEDCAAQGLICMTQAGVSACGMLCTNPCATGQSRCSVEIWQTCETDTWGCLRWEDHQDCAATSLQCEDTTGDATCVQP